MSLYILPLEIYIHILSFTDRKGFVSFLLSIKGISKLIRKSPLLTESFKCMYRTPQQKKIIGFKTDCFVLPNGNLHGFYTRYYSDGKIYEKGCFKNGQPIGKITRWYGNGQIFLEGTYKHSEFRGYVYLSRPKGIWKIFNRNGTELFASKFNKKTEYRIKKALKKANYRIDLPDIVVWGYKNSSDSETDDDEEETKVRCTSRCTRGCLKCKCARSGKKCNRLCRCKGCKNRNPKQIVKLYVDVKDARIKKPSKQ